MTTTEQSTVDSAKAKADALRKLADMIEAHPEIEATYLDPCFPRSIWSARSADELAAIARAALAHGAKVDKDIDDRMYNVVVSWYGVKFEALATRNEVCERVKVGQETITKSVTDPAAPLVEVTETVDKYEWNCAPLLASVVDGEA